MEIKLSFKHIVVTHSITRLSADDLRTKVEGAKAEAAEKVEPKGSRAAAITAQAILAIFKVRGVAVSEQDRARIVACDDLQVLNRWFLQAQEVSAAAELA